MLVQRRVMSWRRVAKALQTLAAHGFLLLFTIFLVLKLDRLVSYSWWYTFFPLWLFHVVVARGRFSIPAPAMPHDRQWAPYHAVMATPLLVAFELLLCIFLEGNYAMNLKIVYIPLLALEVAIFVDNVRMCKALMPGDEELVTDEAIWETLPHFWVSISMVFFIAATTFTLLKLCGDVEALNWWDLFINFGIAECFACLICTKWYNPAIHRLPFLGDTGSSSANITFVDWNGGILASSAELQQQSRICSLQDIGGHIMKIPLLGFQIALFMRLEGTPPSARDRPFSVIFSPLIVLQGAGFLFAIYRFIEKVILFMHSGASTDEHFRTSSKARECFEFMLRGSRLLGWWSIDERSRKEQAQLYCSEASGSGYNTFAPDAVKKMPKSDLVEEISRLQEALSEQRDVSYSSQQEYERLQNEKILCRVCFDEQINIVLLPCRHYIICSTCGEKCKRCPICRECIEERLPVYDV